MQDIITKDDLNYKLKCGKNYNFCKYSLLIVSLRDTHKGYSSTEKPDKKQRHIEKHLKIKSFSNNLGLLFSAREKVQII